MKALRWFPGLASLRGYDRRWLRHDLVAGLVLTAFLVPVGMGYAQAAGLPPITGLYATIVPLLAYAVFGPSKVMVLGPDSSLAAVIAALVVVLANGSPVKAIEVAGVLALATGLVILVAGITRLGFVTELLSRPARLGYLSGIALTIIVGQLPKVFGFAVGGDGLIQTAWAFLQGVADGYTNVASLAIGVLALLMIIAISTWFQKLPGTLLAVTFGIAAVSTFDLGVDVVGVLPEGLPAFQMPTAQLGDLPEIISAALAIALVAIADTSVLSQSLAARRGEEVDPDQEMVALGIANVATGFFQGFPISSSASRTPVAISAGARSQVTPLVGALCVAGLLVAAPDLLRDLPQAVLGAVVIVAAARLVEPSEIRILWRVRRAEFVLWLAAFFGVAFLGVLFGIFVAILLSLGDFVRRAWRPHDATLGRVDELKGYHDIERYPTARQIPGLLLYRFDGPLFFANASFFRREVRVHLDNVAHPIRWVVVAAEPITDVDTTAAEMLGQLVDELHERGVVLAFAQMKDPVKDRLRRYELMDRIGEHRFFPTMGTAVDGYVEATGVDWVDWEDRRPEGHERQSAD